MLPENWTSPCTCFKQYALHKLLSLFNRKDVSSQIKAQSEESTSANHNSLWTTCGSIIFSLITLHFIWKSMILRYLIGSVVDKPALSKDKLQLLLLFKRNEVVYKGLKVKNLQLITIHSWLLTSGSIIYWFKFGLHWLYRLKAQYLERFLVYLGGSVIKLESCIVWRIAT